MGFRTLKLFVQEMNLTAHDCYKYVYSNIQADICI